MFCAYCQKKLIDDATFCNRCGKQVRISAADAHELSRNNIQQISSATRNSTSYNAASSGSTGVLVAASTKKIRTVATPLPLSALQRLLVRVFQPNLAGNILFGPILGSVIAVCAGILACWLLLTIVHFVTPSEVQQTLLTNSESQVDRILGITLLNIPFRDMSQLFLVMHGISIHTLYNGNGYVLTMPLNGLLVVPAVFLIIGGYIAASTDLQNGLQSSLLRGAAIAIPYTVLLLILSWQVNGDVPSLPGTTGSIHAILMVDTGTLFLAGLFWGGLFGVLGASLKIARGQWRHMLRRYLDTTTHPQIAGMITGACYACVLGLGLSFITLCALLVDTTLSIPLPTRNLCISGDWQTLTAWGIAQGPLHVANLFFVAFGAPVTSHGSSVAYQSCFYTNLSQTSFALQNQTLHLTPWIYALLLIPAISLFIGGQISYTLSRTRGKDPAAISGALIAIPFTIIMLFLAWICTVTTTTVSSNVSAPLVQSAGVNATNLFLWALLSGALFGALGGLYQESGAKKWGKRFLTAPIFIIELFAKPFYALIAVFSRQSIALLHNATRSLLCSALVCTLLLAIMTIVVSAWLITNNQVITLQTNQQVCNIVSVLLIAIPGLLLFCASVLALARDPRERELHRPSSSEPIIGNADR